jgi:type II secretory pathway pseudopilin PulG
VLTPGRPRRGDGGLGVVELAVAMAVTAILLAVVGPVLVGVLRAYGKVQDTSLAADRGRVVLDRLDRDLRQASSVNLPTQTGTRVYLEYATDVTAPGTAAACTQWRLDTSSQQLDVRSWASGTTTAPGWRTAATGVVNAPATEPPFSVSPATAAAPHQQLAVQLRLRLPRGQALTRTLLTGRNTSTTSPSNADADGDGASDTQVCTTFGRP